MFVERVPLEIFGANCYLLAPEAGGECVVVDPGCGGLEQIRARIAANGLEVAAVLLTHGHPDHVWDAAAIAGDKPVYIPAPDAHRLDDPLALLPISGADQIFPGDWVKPVNIVQLHEVTRMIELIEGVSVKLVPAPGHTEGSSLFFFAGPIGAISDAPIGALTGDVVFKGSIGRSDLPGGDGRQMLHTLRTLCNSVNPETCLLPGHGETTTMAAELQTNPYLRQARFEG